MLERDFENIVIVGLGLIGGSIARDVKRIHPHLPVYAVDNNAKVIEEAKRKKDIRKGINLEAALHLDSVLIIISSPISTIEHIAKEISNVSTGKKATIIDVASIKSKIVSTFEQLTNDKIEFVGTHPMAGTEFTGYEHARLSLFHAKPWIICKHSKNTDDTIQAVERLITSLGGNYRYIPAKDHDRMVSLVSHSMLMISNMIFDLVATDHERSLELAGDGFKGVVRTAGGNPQLHVEILENNKSRIIESLALLNSHIQKHIDTNLSEMNYEYFAKNVNRHHRWIYTKK